MRLQVRVLHNLLPTSLRPHCYHPNLSRYHGRMQSCPSLKLNYGYMANVHVYVDSSPRWGPWWYFKLLATFCYRNVFFLYFLALVQFNIWYIKIRFGKSQMWRRHPLLILYSIISTIMSHRFGWSRLGSRLRDQWGPRVFPGINWCRRNFADTS